MKNKFLTLLLLPFFLVSCADNRDFAVIYKEKCDKFEKLTVEDYNCDIDFVGDSITEKWDLKKYFKDYKVANRGISGDTTDMLLTRMEVSAFNLNPKVISLLIGTNNIDTCLNNYDAILDGFYQHLPNTHVVVVGILPRRGEEYCQKIKAVNKEISLLTEKYQYCYVDMYDLLAVDEYKVDESLFKDGLHPNKKGYQVMTDFLMPVFDSFLK